MAGGPSGDGGRVEGNWPLPGGRPVGMAGDGRVEPASPQRREEVPAPTPPAAGQQWPLRSAWLAPVSLCRFVWQVTVTWIGRMMLRSTYQLNRDLAL